jgi:hypothetical protein
MELWHEPDEIRIAVAQERLARERPLRPVHAPPEARRTPFPGIGCGVTVLPHDRRRHAVRVPRNDSSGAFWWVPERRASIRLPLP